MVDHVFACKDTNILSFLQTNSSQQYFISHFGLLFLRTTDDTEDTKNLLPYCFSYRVATTFFYFFHAHNCWAFFVLYSLILSSSLS